MLFCQHSIHANCKSLEQSEYQSSLSYKREDAKADPFTWIRLHTHTCMHAQIQSLNYCNAIRVWHPPLHICFQWHPHLPSYPAYSSTWSNPGTLRKLSALSNPGTQGKLLISVILKWSRASDLFFCEIYTGWFLVHFRVLFIADNNVWNSHKAILWLFSLYIRDPIMQHLSHPLVSGVNT